MRQYFEAKRQYRHALLFFRMGDFYEMFYEDALVASRALDLTLTSRSKDSSGAAVPMCGVPFHAADGYITRLVRKGYRVAICEQIEDPKKAKGVVKRDVVRVVSPGTLTDASYLDAREPAFLMAILASAQGAQVRRVRRVRSTASPWWICPPVSSTWPNTPAPTAWPRCAKRSRCCGRARSSWPPATTWPALIPEIAQIGAPITEIDGWHFELESARQTLIEQLRVGSLEGFGLERRQAAVCAAGALVRHLRDTQKAELAHVRTVRLRQLADGLLIDPTTMKHLEVVESTDGGRAGSLLDEIDRTVTPMGCRLLRTWLLRPLTSLEAHSRSARCGRGAGGPDHRSRQGPRDAEVDPGSGAADLRASRLSTAGPARSHGAVAIAGGGAATAPCCCRSARRRWCGASPASSTICRTCASGSIAPSPTSRRRSRATAVSCATGSTQEVDDLRHISRSGKQVIAEMEDGERTRTGIASLKVRFNRVFGYYIEISKSNLHAVPQDYIRKQTIAGGERFITPALKEYEEKVLGADERIVSARARDFRVACGSAWPRRRRGCSIPRAPWPASTCSAGSPKRRRPATTPSRTCTTATRFPPPTCAIPVVERLAGGTFVPNDIQLNVDHAPAGDPDGPEHGRQVHLPAAGRAALPARADRVVRAGTRGQDRIDRSPVRAGRRVRQHRPRPVHLHGGNAGDLAHPQRRDLEVPGRARRDRPRHRHLRRLEHRLGGGRIHRHQPARRGRRRCSRRTITS